MFYSVMFPTEKQNNETRKVDVPSYFKDLNLDQIFTPILKSQKNFNLDNFYYTPLHDPEIIIYRQDVMRELEDKELHSLFMEFSKTIRDLDIYMSSVRNSLASKDTYKNNYLTRGQMLDYADRYCTAISKLYNGIAKYNLHSAGLTSFCKYLSSYCTSEKYLSLSTYVEQLRKEFSTVEYCMFIKNGTIRVRKYEGEADQSKQILSIFDKFRQGDVKDYRQTLSETPYASHIESAVLNMVADLYKDIFANLNQFCSEFIDFTDEIILRFSCEIQFYLSWLDYIRFCKMEGLPFNYPSLCTSKEHLYDFDAFDLALASSMGKETVTNDFVLDFPERILVVTGPNQGGKTTFARAFGQIHYLASLGLCIPGRKSSLYLFDHIYTHFGREEDLSTMNGKLQDDLLRLHDLLEKATDKSIIIINEIFSSTTLSDALILGGYMMDELSSLGSLAVIVTFLDELASYGAETVSMMSMVDTQNTAIRTYKITRKPPDGLAYALYIAGKHGLTYDQLCRRLIK